MLEASSLARLREAISVFSSEISKLRAVTDATERVRSPQKILGHKQTRVLVLPKGKTSQSICDLKSWENLIPFCLDFKGMK